MAKPIPRLSPDEVQAVIATAFEDKPPYNAVLLRHGVSHGELVQLLKRVLTPSAYKLWAARGKPGKGGSNSKPSPQHRNRKA